MRALIVEDNEISSRVLEKLLKPYAKSDITDNGSDAIDRFLRANAAGEQYDVIFLDIMMPEGDGYLVLRTIREFEKEHDIGESEAVSVIMISALEDTKNVLSAFSAGCDGYLVKPVGKADLEHELKQLQIQLS